MRYETQKEKSKRKSNSWREWCPPATPPNKENPGDKALSNFNLSYDEREELQDLEILIKTVVKRPKILPPPATSEIPPPLEEIYPANPVWIQRQDTNYCTPLPANPV